MLSTLTEQLSAWTLNQIPYVGANASISNWNQMRTGAVSAPVRILFVAPNSEGLDSQPEIRDISSRRHIQITVLNGVVTSRDIYTHARDGYDVLHFVAHGGEEGVALSDDSILTYQEIAQIARLARTQIIFFNSCQTGKPASYVVHHGVLWAIFGNISIEDSTAWQHPIGFYSSLVNLEPKTIANALRIADNSSGDYGYTISIQYLLELINKQEQSSAYELKSWQLAFIGFSLLVSTIVSILVLASGS